MHADPPTPLASIERTAPDRLDSIVIEHWGDVHSQPVRFYIYGDVLDELRYAADFYDGGACAFLIGVYGTDERGGFVEVRGFDGLFEVGEEDDLYRSMRHGTDRWIAGGEATRFPIVGGFFSVPGSRGELDEEIARVHLSLFNIPFQLAVVVDPDSRRIGAYARPPGLKFKNIAFSVARRVAESHAEESE